MLIVGIITIVCAGLRWIISFNKPTIKEFCILICSFVPGANLIAMVYFATTLFHAEFYVDH
jgi:hypothetical protein